MCAQLEIVNLNADDDSREPDVDAVTWLRARARKHRTQHYQIKNENELSCPPAIVLMLQLT
jgi:hypothetical protein